MAESYWLPHESLVWIPATIVTSSGGLTTYRTCQGEELTLQDEKVNPATLERVSEQSLKGGLSNLVNLDEFGEGAVIHQLRERFARDEIYTNIGSILVSVNPYHALPIYGAAQIDNYSAAAAAGPQALAAMEPHIFSIAAQAYSLLYEESEATNPAIKHNQAVIISGESGAGKTEATKSVLQYLSEVAGSVSGVEQQILQSNPILEAFGNAKTLRNNNSSRFGKWLSVSFEPVPYKGAPSTGHAPGRKIVAAKIVNYLLEQSRVTSPGGNERSYHIFYQLLAGASPELKAQLSLGAPSDYSYLRQSGCYEVEGVDEVEDFAATTHAMQSLQFAPETVSQIWQLLAAILQIGNLIPASNPQKSDVTLISNKDALALTTKTLGLSSDMVLASALCYRSVTIRGSISMIPLNVAEVAANRDALSKTLYAKLFDNLIVRMNQVLFTAQGGEDKAKSTEQSRAHARSIGILDIFGFEIFESNLFEQFCINYANEKLQQHFNLYIFKLEQEEYAAEGIDVRAVTFVDNIDCLNLIESRGGASSSSSSSSGPLQGILSMMDEELLIPKGSDASLISKMHQAFASKGNQHKHYDLLKKNQEIFIIKHYAGEVQYNSQGLLAKNKNKLNDNLEQLMAGGSSSLAIIKEIFAAPGDKAAEDAAAAAAASTPAAAAPAGPPPGLRRAGTLNSPSNAKAKKEATLGFQFCGQLADLMATLHSCNPHYVRTLKPNAKKMPGLFDTRMVLAQMSYAGLFEAIRIRKSGFPFRKALADFFKRYKVCLTKSQIVEYSKAFHTEPREGVNLLLKSLTPATLSAEHYQTGKSKVFLKTHARNALDALRDQHLLKWAVQIQAWSRMLRAVRLRRRLKAFETECEAALTSDLNEQALGDLMARANDAGFQHHLFVLSRVACTLKAVQEITRVLSVLARALENGSELEPLEGALEQVQRLQKAHPTVVPSDLSESAVAASKVSLLKQLSAQSAAAARQRDYLLELQRLKQALQAAILAEVLEDLAKALEAATQFGMDAQLPVMREATQLLEKLRAEEALMEKLRVATKARASKDDLQAAITAVQRAGVSLDGTRKRDMADAITALKDLHAETMRAAVAAKDEQSLTSTIIPKLSQMGYADLVAEAQRFLAEAEAAREAERKAEAERKRLAEEAARAEAARQREAARAAEEARLAQERQGLAAAEKARLEEEDRVRRAQEDQAREQAEAQERARVEAAERKQAEEAAAARLASTAAAASAAASSSAAPPPPAPADADMPPPPMPPAEDDLPPPPAPDDDGMPPPPAAPSSDADLPPPPPSDSGDVPLPPPPPADDDLPPPPAMPAPPAARDSAPSFAAPPALAEHPVDVELDAAIMRRNIPALDKALATATAFKHSSRLVRVAQNMRANLIAEQRIRTELTAAVNKVNVETCKRLLKEAANLGIAKDPLLEEARSICYGMSTEDLLLLRIRKTLPLNDTELLRKLLVEAAELKITSNDYVEQAKDFLAHQLFSSAASSSAAGGENLAVYADLDWNSTMRANRNAVVPPSEYYKFVSSKGNFPLNETVFPPLRRAGNYAKGKYLSKTELKEKRLQHQTDSMPRSLVKLSTEYCGGSKDRSKQIKLLAKQVFKNIRGYMRDTYHSYPATLAYDVLMTAIAQPLLRDEVYCQLIKQTTANPSADSQLLGLKLLYLCLSSFQPSPALKPCLWSHLAQFAHPTLPEGAALGFQLPADVASACYVTMEHVSRLAAAGIAVKPPSMADIESMTTGALAKRSGKFSDTIREATAAAATAAASAAARHKGPEEDADLPAPPPS